jgi:hypothetical protein
MTIANLRYREKREGERLKIYTGDLSALPSAPITVSLFEISDVSDLIMQHELNESSLAIQCEPGCVFKLKGTHVGSLGISL